MANGNGNRDSGINTAGGSLIVQPTQLIPAMRHAAPGLAEIPARPPTMEQALGSRNYFIEGLDRIASPEDANADYSIFPAEMYHASALLQVPAVIWLQGSGLITSADYNVLSNYQYFREGAAFVGSAGRNDQNEYPATSANGVDFVMSAPTAPNLVLGVILEWSSQLQTSSAFTMKVSTTMFKSISYQTLDRSFDVRISPGGRTPDGSIQFANGGVLAFTFGQRISKNDTCGCLSGSGCTNTLARGGMMKAIVQPAFIATFSDVDIDPFPPMFIPGLTVRSAAAESPPLITVTVPAAIGAGFSVLARYLTAASPALASVQAALLASGYSQITTVNE